MTGSPINDRRIVFHMADMELIAQVRALPSRGRARLNTGDIDLIPVKEGEAIEISLPGQDKPLVVTVFADQHVEKGYIRLDKADLDQLGVGEGTRLAVRRKAGISEGLKKSTDEMAKTVGSGIDAMGAKIGAAIDPGVKKIDEGLKTGAAAVSGAAGSIPVPEQVTNLIESAKKKLTPGDAAQLAKILKENEGSVKSVIVASGAPVRMLSGIKIPAGVTVAAVKRGDDVLIHQPTLAILAGDTVFLIGSEPGLSEAVKVIGA
jgi:hypothetical protein